MLTVIDHKVLVGYLHDQAHRKHANKEVCIMSHVLISVFLLSI
jgi:hypothetical protein